ncbi:MAG TPA: PhzF family phenazine biosynthesis protein [Pyrinomonadaceae bacterium]|jgi:PhzF family phenazine biosynthesis protein
MGLTITQVDAFTDQPFAGNPAAVCVLPAARAESWMQAVAREMNLSETAFLVPRGSDYDLRWFTPTVEVDLCGHATLASAHVLWESGQLSPDAQARFHTRSGLLTATRRGAWIELDLPARPVTELSAAPAEVVRALGVEPVFAGRTKDDYLIEVRDEEAVRNLNPDFGLLKRADLRGAIVTARATTPGYDFVSRFFVPGAGIDEDPVTGAAHCVLGPYWQPRLQRDEFMAYQASARGGTIKVRVDGDRVYLGGQAVTVLRGELAERAS